MKLHLNPSLGLLNCPDTLNKMARKYNFFNPASRSNKFLEILLKNKILRCNKYIYNGKQQICREKATRTYAKIRFNEIHCSLDQNNTTPPLPILFLNVPNSA